MSIVIAAALAAAAGPACDAPTRTTQQDFSATLQRLRISATRPGPSGNLSNPNHANNDEAQAYFTSPMPDPLRFDSGRPMRGAFDWVQRRRELIRNFEENIVGRVPNNVPAVSWRTASETRITIGDVPVIDKRLVATVTAYRCSTRTLTFNVRLLTPANAAGPVPVVLSYLFVFPGFPQPPLTAASMTGQLVAAGIGHATMDPTEVQPDSGGGITGGIIGLTNDNAVRKPDEWGALRAWSWGASRALDYLSQDPAVDARRVAIEGLSRFGKTVLVTMAFDERFAAGFSGSSGEGGASPYRRVFGERVENVAGSGEYHWMAPAFVRYAGPLDQDDLPIDANSLIALSAPRPLFLGNGNLDADWWTDPRGAFLAAASASPVWTTLGAAGLTSTDYPAANVQLGTTGLTWRQHTGGHTNSPNWQAFIAWSKASWAR